jgi:hypothetical protein
VLLSTAGVPSVVRLFPLARIPSWRQADDAVSMIRACLRSRHKERLLRSGDPAGPWNEIFQPTALKFLWVPSGIDGVSRGTSRETSMSNLGDSKARSWAGVDL